MKEHKFVVGEEVVWRGYNAGKQFGIWYGTIIGTGPEGVTVEFGSNFVGHGGWAVSANNEQLTNSPRGNAWYFDYNPENENMNKTEELELVKESE